MIKTLWATLTATVVGLLACAGSATAAAEYNRVTAHRPASVLEAQRLIVAFRPAADNTPARTSDGDVARLVKRTRLAAARSRQLTPSMHVVWLAQPLHGAQLDAALRLLRDDPQVKFADVDQRRYLHAAPDDPLFKPSANAAGQWYLLPPSTVTAAGDAAATDALSAWVITQGSSGTVIADIDTGVRFDHPDLLRAGLAGRLLPGYDFVGEDFSSSGMPLDSFLIANDGDGWDPDPSDPGDWINSSDQSNALFPAKDCPIQDSSWHGTRVMGILGALTNNGVGIAGMTWNAYLLPVRALGKCGGFDSDIITAMQWAAGLPVTGVPDNPYPANIINLSLGGMGSCPTAYAEVVSTLATRGVLVVASAGNGSQAPTIAPVDSPANCPGVLGVAGLRNVGTKVGYSSLGREVGVAAPAGNCVVTSGGCLRSIDTTSNTGLTGPAAASYTDEINPNLGTSFSAPIVSGIAALMRAVNANLTPAQLIARLQSSALPFPQPAGLPVCPAIDVNSGECACPNDGTQCGAGMVNALAAVASAQRPIAAVAIPASGGVGANIVLDASGSAAACGRTLVSFAWSASGGVVIQPGSRSAARATVVPQGTAGSLSLTVTDSSGAVDRAQLSVSASGSIAKSPATPDTAGGNSGACPVARSVAVVAPSLSASFSPPAVGINSPATLTLTLENANGFDLTQSNLTVALPQGLVAASPGTAATPAATTCSGNGADLTAGAGSLNLSGANIPAYGSCAITVAVHSATPGTYIASIAANALTTAAAGASLQQTTATLTVTAPSSGGGGAIGWWDMLFAVGVILAGRRGPKRPAKRLG